MRENNLIYPRFSMITDLAYVELINHGCRKLPITEMNFTDKHGDKIIVQSFREYIRLTENVLKVEDLTLNYFPDGYAIQGIRPGVKLILYNDERYVLRRRFTIYHEVGHFMCQHKMHGSVEEVEAYFFASQFLMPNAIIKFLINKHYRITPEFLVKCFGVSKEAANKKLDYIKRYDIHESQYDDKIILLFKGYLLDNYPDIMEHYTEQDFIVDRFGSVNNYKELIKLENNFLEPDWNT